jgi:hypothetical protein
MQISTRNSEKLGLMAQHTLEIALQELTCGGLYSTAIDRQTIKDSGQTFKQRMTWQSKELAYPHHK